MSESERGEDGDFDGLEFERVFDSIFNIYPNSRRYDPNVVYWLEPPLTVGEIKGYLCSMSVVRTGELESDFPLTERKEELIEALVNVGADRFLVENVLADAALGRYLAISDESL